jgi:hypothetical protein
MTNQEINKYIGSNGWESAMSRFTADDFEELETGELFDAAQQAYSLWNTLSGMLSDVLNAEDSTA